MPPALLCPRHGFILPRVPIVDIHMVKTFPVPDEPSSDEEGGGEEGGTEGSEKGSEEGGEEESED